MKNKNKNKNQYSHRFEQIIQQFNDNKFSYPRRKSVQALFKNQVQIRPKKIAIEFGEKKITYKKLDEKSDILGGFIDYFSTKARQQKIYFFIDRNIDLVISMLATLKSGNIFVPINPKDPKERVRLVFKKVNPDWIITQDKYLNFLLHAIENISRVNILLIDKEEKNCIKKDNFRILSFGCLPKKLLFSLRPANPQKKSYAYIYYTSGSSGQPKAVLGLAESLTHFMEWEIKEFNLSQKDRFSQFTRVSFNAILRDIFVPLSCGATLCIPEDETIIFDPVALVKWIEDNRISLIHCVPSLFKAIASKAKQSRQLKNLKYILMAGEQIKNDKSLSNFLNLFKSRINLVNLYGQTETTLIKFYHRISLSDLKRDVIPIGKPMEGAKAIILDNKKAQSPGIKGEIVIKTPFRTAGYFNDSNLTKKVFIKNPLKNDPQDIIYQITIRW